jgi:hypothetical protein
MNGYDLRQQAAELHRHGQELRAHPGQIRARTARLRAARQVVRKRPPTLSGKTEGPS